MGRELRRVALDFDWPLQKVWSGFVNPHHKDCGDCDGRGSTTAMGRLNDLVSLLMLSGSDAARQQAHPYFSHGPFHRTCGITPSLDMVELTAGLAGRKPDGPFGHDTCDQWNATKKIIAAAGLPKTWGQCPSCDGDGIDKDCKAAYEAWEPTDPPAGDGWQMWETVSEGSPISPVFATAEELADWLGVNRAEDGTRDQWFAMITAGGWAPSLVIQGGRVMSGVEAVTEVGK